MSRYTRISGIYRMTMELFADRRNCIQINCLAYAKRIECVWCAMNGRRSIHFKISHYLAEGVNICLEYASMSRGRQGV